MGEATKRKGPPGGDARDRQLKKSKGGNKGKWQTTSHKVKLEAQKARGRALEVGDVGFWVSCQRTKEQKALEELVAICDEYGEKVYGIKPGADGEDSDEDADIEASIQKEVNSMNAAKKSRGAAAAFTPMRVALDCLLFVKTKAPVEPRAFIRSICDDAQLAKDRTQRKSRFINRFIPITLMGRASENGVEEIAKTVLSEHFQLAGVDDQPPDSEDQGPSYAIRYQARAHNTLKREDVIKQVAALIGSRHKVNLTAPDKVILIEIYQTFCGMSVVDGDFDALKRYNLNELYVASFQAQEDKNKPDEEKSEHVEDVSKSTQKEINPKDEESGQKEAATK